MILVKKKGKEGGGGGFSRRTTLVGRRLSSVTSANRRLENAADVSINPLIPQDRRRREAVEEEEEEEVGLSLSSSASWGDVVTSPLASRSSAIFSAEGMTRREAMVCASTRTRSHIGRLLINVVVAVSARLLRVVLGLCWGRRRGRGRG